MSIYLAYDGSINGDWIARYAIQLAAHHPDRALTLLWVEETGPAAAQMPAKFERIERECRQFDLAFTVETVPLVGSVFATLARRLPEGRDTFVVCGARVRSRGRGFLTGTVSQHLLAHRQFNVMALRVVQPGLLGAPRSLLVPIPQDPAALRTGLPFLRLLAVDAQRVQLLHVVTADPRLLRLTPERTAALRRRGWEYLRQVEEELIDSLAIEPQRVDATVSVARDWARQIVIHAGRHNSGLIYMEAPRRSLARLLLYGDPLERVLREAPCDVAVYRGTR